jgi:predicted TIM-barrel fold metal-dependent hydrolase
MPLVDFHTHAFPDALAPAAIAALKAQGNIPAYYDGTVGGLIESMDRAGTDVSVVQPVATKPGQVRSINDWAASLSDERIVPFGAMHPDLEDPRAEVARMAGMGLRGFKMHPEYQDFELHESRMERVYEAAAEHGMIVLFHAGGDVAFDTSKGTPSAFASVLDDWPGLRAVLAHLGGFREWPGVTEHLAGRDVLLDTAYTLGHLRDEDFVAIVRAHGAHRVMFGSDGPWTDSAGELEHMRRLGFTQDELDAILGGNAAHLLGL